MATLHICSIVLRNAKNGYRIARIGTGLTRRDAQEDAFQFTDFEARLCANLSDATGEAYLQFCEKLHEILFDSPDAESALAKMADLPDVEVFTFYNIAE